MATYTLKNEQPGARGIDEILVDAGASRSGVELTDAQVALLKKHGQLIVTKDSEAKVKADESKALDKMNKAELLAIAEVETVTGAKDADGNDIAIADATNAQIIAAIEAARAA